MKYKNYSIADLLGATVEEAITVLENIPQIQAKVRTLYDVGLGYIHLGQSSTTLSGGEAQRIKLAKELSRKQTGRTFYILDEPTTGLHFEDVRRLLDVLHQLVEMGNTVLVIEHQLDVIKTADWIIDLGPEGGEGGGEIVAMRNSRADHSESPEPYAQRARKDNAQWEGSLSKYRIQPLDFGGLKTVSIHERGGKVRIEHFAKTYQKGSGVLGHAGCHAAFAGVGFAPLCGAKP